MLLNTIGQTGYKFKTRYNEYVKVNRSNKSNSKYAQHVLENKHTYGPIQDRMEILWITKKGQYEQAAPQHHVSKITVSTVI